MDEILERFIQAAPVAVLVRATLGRILADTTLDDLFNRVAQAQYTRELTFSAVVKLMVKVTFGTHDSVHAAYRHTAGIPVSITAVYDKLARVETAVSGALVQETAEAMGRLLAALPWPQTEAVAGLRLRTLDGNFLAGTEHRLACLRGCGAAALPGMSLVVRDGQSGLLTNIVPCEDAYTSERSLHPEIMTLVHANDLWLSDCNFCTLDYMAGFDERQAYFLVRHHGGTHLHASGTENYIGKNPTGKIYEQKVRASGFQCRCIIIKLNEPLRDGTTEIRLLSNVPPTKASAKRLAALYRTRWQIETAFQELTVSLCCELNTLGYPKAALFAFALACVAYNLLVVTQAALKGGQGKKKIEDELSSHHLATEMATISEGLAIAVPWAIWQRLAQMTTKDFAAWMHRIAKTLDFKRYRKNKRGPKKPIKVKRTRRGAHRSTARVLAAQAQPP
jgi:Transposase DDE domain